MAVRRVIRVCIVSLIILVNVGCDQVSKSIVRKNVDLAEQIPLIGNQLILTKVENTGAFLSAGGNLPLPVRHLVLSLLPTIVLAGALGVAFFNRNLTRPVLAGLCFVIGGGIGNIFDRIVRGSVTDFLHIDLGWIQTGIFNLADVSIMIGFALLLMQYIGGNRLVFRNK